MSVPAWSELEALFHEALARPSAARATFLAERCAGRPDLRLQIDAMLRAHDEARGALDVSIMTPPARLARGTRLGAYEIAGPLGAGGMGEVYRARDTTLRRDVAIKILPAAFVADADLAARFEREARVLATLNHPNIAAIYGFEQGALILELVEGETLADRIARGPIPITETLGIAHQIAEALEAAHERGIVHRDLKPANIKVTPAGVVKVLDFGLAKTVVPAAGGTWDTVAINGTREGLILGTAAYMSPEQARGQQVDKRTDIWAFGCVLYAMLTGRAAFAGETHTDTLAAIIEREPDWTVLPPETPVAIRTLLTRCLDKDRRLRIGDISTARFLLTEHTRLGATGHEHDSQGPARARHDVRATARRTATHVAAALVASAVVGAGVWMATHPIVIPPRVSRLLIAPSGAAGLTIGGGRDLAITPDGSHVVYVGNNGTQLFVRALDELEPLAVFTGKPSWPFISPDGQWIGFVDNSTTLKKVAVAGGAAVTLAILDVNAAMGATWAPDDTIIFATGNAPPGLQRVAAAGGPTTILARPDRTRGEWYVFPEMLPGGRGVLFTINTGGEPDAAQVAVLDLRTGIRTILVRGGSHAHYVPSGHLIYAAAGTLRAVPFDLASSQTRGTPVVVIPEVVTKRFGAVDAVVAGDGTLAYVAGRPFAAAQKTLAWVDRQGHETPVSAPPRAYTYLRLSPDGTRAAVWASDQDLDLWIWDMGRTTLARFTFEPGLDTYPVWTPDGRRLIFTSDRSGPRNLFWQAADGTGTAERLTESPNQQYATAVTPDGHGLVFTESTPNTGDDVMRMELDGTHHVTPLVQSSFAERNGIVSPDGRWLAYEANDSGRFEIHVRPFPAVNSGHWQVSTDGGTRPIWARSGQELVYLSSAGAVMRVGVDRAPAWSATTPTLLVKEGYSASEANYFGRTYDIAPDGQRFLMTKEGSSVQTATPPSLIVVQHWDEELKRLLPTR